MSRNFLERPLISMKRRGFSPLGMHEGQRAAPQGPTLLQWWAQISGRERISIISIVAGAIIVIVNAISWPVALSYIQRQQTIARLSDAVLHEEAAEAAAMVVAEVAELNGDGVARRATIQ